MVAASSAHDRSHPRRRAYALGQLRGCEHASSTPPQARFGQRHHLDHALVGFARARPEREDAVLVENEAQCPLCCLEHFGRLLGKREARHDVRNDPHAAVISVGAERFPVRLINQAQHRGGMSMVNEPAGHKGVQQRFDGRIGRHWVDQIGALDRDHLFIRQCVARAHPTQRLEPHGRQPGRLDLTHVPARAFDAQNVDVIAHEVRDAQLH